MLPKHVLQPSPIYEQMPVQQPGVEKRIANESVISAFAKKNIKEKSNSTELLDSLIFVKECIDSDPERAKKSIEKIISDLR